MKLWIAAVVLVSFQAQAQLRCENLFASSPRNPITLVDEFLRLRRQISEMPAGTEKVFWLDQLRAKHREVKAILGPEFERIVSERAKLAVIEASKESKETARETARDHILRWTRVETHPDLEFVGPFVNETQLYASREGRLAIYETTSKSFVWTSRTGDRLTVEWATKMLLSEDKKFLYLVNVDSVARLERATGDIKNAKLTSPARSHWTVVRLARDGRHLFATGSAGESMVLKSDTLSEVWSEYKGSKGEDIVESPDGRYVFFVRGGGHHKLFDVNAGQVAPFPNGREIGLHSVHAAMFSKDSKTLTVADMHSRWIDLDLQNGQFHPSRFATRSRHFYETEDGRHVIAFRNVQHPEGTDKRPFTVFERATGKDVTPKLDGFHFYLPMYPYLLGKKFVFVDRGTESPQSETQYFHYVLDTSTLTLERLPADQARFFLRNLIVSPGEATYFGQTSQDPRSWLEYR